MVLFKKSIVFVKFVAFLLFLDVEVSYALFEAGHSSLDSFQVSFSLLHGLLYFTKIGHKLYIDVLTDPITTEPSHTNLSINDR